MLGIKEETVKTFEYVGEIKGEDGNLVKVYKCPDCKAHISMKDIPDHDAHHLRNDKRHQR